MIGILGIMGDELEEELTPNFEISAELQSFLSTTFWFQGEKPGGVFQIDLADIDPKLLKEIQEWDAHMYTAARNLLGVNHWKIDLDR